MLYSNKDLKKLIIPLVIEQTLAIAVGMADTIMISVVGEAAVSGVSLVDTVNILLINVFSALATGGAVVAGHFLGQKHPEEASKAAWRSSCSPLRWRWPYPLFLSVFMTSCCA